MLYPVSTTGPGALYRIQWFGPMRECHVSRYRYPFVNALCSSIAY
jgi:hypothetical protein